MSPLKRFIRIGLPVIAAIGLAGYLLVYPVYDIDSQLSAGRACMDSLSPGDIQAWIERSKKLIAQRKSDDPDWKTPIPEDLQKLKIVQIIVDQKSVRYIWCEGWDYCGMRVQRMDDGTYQVHAQYDEEHSRVIWPKP